MYKIFLRPLFFLIDPEKIHHTTFRLIKITAKIPLVSFFRRKIHVVNDSNLSQNIFGLDFNNPVGLAAGFDKNAVLYDELADFGFGFIEIGTVTPKPQDGNPKKRLFRLKADNSLINRMGFNNGGVNKAVEQLKKRKKGNLIIGGNIGKNTSTLPENVIKDYVINFETLFDHVDYFVVNVSCPNVGSMAKLQDKDFQVELLDKLQSINKSKIKRKPILLKIAPDLNNQQLDEVIEIISETNIDGVIASNTSVNREGLRTPISELEKIGNGGLSGQAVKDRSTGVIKYLYDKSNKQFPIIGVGGIHSANDAIEKIEAGASLVQIYTGFIYEGPKLVKRINKAIIKNNIKL